MSEEEEVNVLNQNNSKDKASITKKGFGYESFVSGGLAGMVAKTIISPIERVKLIFMVGRQQFRYLAAIAKLVEIAKNERIVGLWRGNSMSMLRVFPYTAIVDQYDKAIRCLRPSTFNLSYRICYHLFVLRSGIGNSIKPSGLSD